MKACVKTSKTGVTFTSSPLSLDGGQGMLPDIAATKTGRWIQIQKLTVPQGQGNAQPRLGQNRFIVKTASAPWGSG
ncbi:hypothetical protein PE067_10100 [Paracoccus sp. DMF-8]|uniref:hypothetical protein n=1 Tax=Paracoccus sp. DMF-8 TaxID=3019445 RepID=UPI0023E82EF5|nr:hypothetical protein [Paracoccus sp. DMF-8]MDF3606462.1 hypothetical protein [Paracoccus sp. DMF-8]